MIIKYLKYVFLSFSLLLFSTIINPIFAQCHRNIENCKGQCGRFIDNNGDSYCDLAKITEKQAIPQKDTIKKTKNPKKEKISEVKTFQMSDCKLDSLKNITANALFKDKTKNIKMACEIKPSKSKYDLISISALTIGFYLITYLLSMFGKLKRVNHRRIWNFILLLSFVFSCLFGFFLVVQLNYNVLPNAFMTILFWHVEIGIAMTIILVFHIFWHLKYYLNSFK